MGRRELAAKGGAETASATPRQRLTEGDISFEHVLSSQYTVFDGLAGMHVEDIYQDREGFLWIATADGGISRLDSARFDTFGLKDGLPNLTVMAIAEDADGRLLFGTFGGGLAAYDGRGFQVYTTEYGLRKPKKPSAGRRAHIRPGLSAVLIQKQGSLWIAGSYSQNAFNEAFQERFAPFSHVMNELKKAQIEGEFFLRDPSVWSQPRP